MRRAMTCSFVVALLTALCAGPANAVVVTLQPGDALGIDVSAHAYQPDTNYDGDGLLYFYRNENSPAGQYPGTNYLRFDMPSFLSDPGVTLQSATLKCHLYQYRNWGGSNTAVVGCAGATQPWGETTLTWNNKPTTDATSTSTVTLSGIPGSATSVDLWSAWDVTPLANAWVAGTRPNYGVILRVDSPNPNSNELRYHPSDLNVWVHQKPRLDIEVTGVESGALYDWEQSGYAQIDDKVGINSHLVPGNGSPGTTTFLDGTGGSFSRTTKDVLTLGTLADEFRYTGAVTLSAWIQPDSSTLGATSSDNPTIVGKYANLTPSDRERGYVLNIDDGKLVMTISPDGTYPAATTVGQSAATMGAGKIYHVAGVFRPGEEMELYINGQSVASLTSGAPAQIHDSPARLTVGGMLWSQGASYINAFGGAIDQVRILDHALTDAEVLQLAHERGPIAVYDWQNHPSGILNDRAGPTLSNVAAPSGKNFPADVADFRYPGNTAGRFVRSQNTVLSLAPGASDADMGLCDPLTVMAWIQPDALTLGRTGDDNPFVAGQYGSTQRAWSLYIDDGKLSFNTSPDGLTYASVKEPAPSMAAAEIYHVCGVFRPGEELELYINGRSVASVIGGVPDSLFSGGGPITVGAMTWGANFYNLFDGVIDDVRIYPYAMTDAEVYFAYIPEPCTLVLLGAGALVALRRRRPAA